MNKSEQDRNETNTRYFIIIELHVRFYNLKSECKTMSYESGLITYRGDQYYDYLASFQSRFVLQFLLWLLKCYIIKKLVMLSHTGWNAFHFDKCMAIPLLMSTANSGAFCYWAEPLLYCWKFLLDIL